ncbi:hypothetical protein NPIL_414561 [Nephila pilipes]|uniref:Uncharacterized protein n=1 Tax=Nephila pilipes TaxID=299642 RepID=A0A8X6NQT5_NEPPI|nr:hypothetical protein NPIL_414561 [Nephila pilipes]
MVRKVSETVTDRRSPMATVGSGLWLSSTTDNGDGRADAQPFVEPNLEMPFDLSPIDSSSPYRSESMRIVKYGENKR